MARDLGVSPARINTTIDFAAAREHGTKSAGTDSVGNAAILAKLAALVAEGKVQVPISARYPLDQVRDAYRELDRRHTRGKIVLVNA
jgi:NADPH:quinone reductase-like Zn-dependent oxidoreductase